MEQKKQAIAGDVVVLSGAVICGDVSIASGSSVWFNAVVRGDEAPISIGENTNIQDCAVLHVDEDCPLRIGSGVTVGHGAILHGCTVGDNALIGMGAIVLNGAKIGKGSMIAAGALVPQNTVVPDGALYMGNPAKFRRMLTEEELTANLKNAANYIKESKDLNN